MVRMPRTAVLLLLVVLALAQLHSGLAICNGKGWVKIAKAAGKPADAVEAAALKLVADNIATESSENGCQIKGWKVVRACKRPVVREGEVKYERYDAIIRLKKTCKGSGASFEYYSSTAKLSNNALAGNKFHLI